MTEQKPTQKRRKKHLKPGSTDGRPRKHVDWKLVARLAEIDCTQDEIGCMVEASPETLKRSCLRDQGVSFEAFYAKRRIKGNISLRRAQMRRALSGNVTMMIWLGKQRLGQKDKHDVTSDNAALGFGMPLDEALRLMKSCINDSEQSEAKK